MPLACGCYNEYPEPGQTWTWFANDYSTYTKPRATRCCDCRKKIKAGDTVTKHARCKAPYSEVEVKIYGEDGEIPLAPHYLCEECSDIWFSLQELGFECVLPEETSDCHAEYVEMVQEERNNALADALMESRPDLHSSYGCGGCANWRAGRCSYPWGKPRQTPPTHWCFGWEQASPQRTEKGDGQA